MISFEEFLVESKTNVTYSNGKYVITVNPDGGIFVTMEHNDTLHSISNLPVNMLNMLRRDNNYQTYGYAQQDEVIAQVIREGLPSIKKHLDSKFVIVK